MECIPKNPYLEFHSDTLQAVRKLWNLDQPGRMEQAINIIEDWVKTQDHFVKNEFSREFLENMIIMNKGLMERVKLKLDKTCTQRTLMPHFFGSYNAKEDFNDLTLTHDVILPKLTPDNYRIFIIKNMTQEYSDTYFQNYYKRAIIAYEYLLKHDYNAGTIVVSDLSPTNIKNLVLKLGLTDLRQLLGLFLDGYGLRIKGIHIITGSKLIDTITTALKQVISAKMAGRIYVHSDIEQVYNFLPKDIFPVDYGGKEKSISELHDEWIDLLSSKEHMEYMKSVNAARTDESRRPVDKFNEQYLGTPGTFRTLIVD